MPRRIHSINQLRPDIFEAIKRAYIKKGIVPRPKQEILKSQEIIKQSKVSQPSPSPQAEADSSGTTASPTDEKATNDGPAKKTTKASNSPEEEKKKNDPKQPENDQSLREVAANVDDVLFEASTVFPFTLVPDTIKLDREKLTIANRIFWWTANITSTPVSEIMSCEAYVGPLFGSLHLTFRFFTDNVREIKFFWREDAMNFQRLMHGYIIANRKEIDVSNIPTPELKKLLEKLGTGASD